MRGAEITGTATKLPSTSRHYARSNLEDHSNWQLIFKPFPVLCVINAGTVNGTINHFVTVAFIPFFLVTCEQQEKPNLRSPVLPGEPC